MATIASRDWALLQEIFLAAAELSPDARELYLAQMCHDAPTLREQVDGMLAAMDSATSIGPIIGATSIRSMHDHLPNAGDQLGAYRIESILGRGGMSVVYRAARADEAYHQVVAIKVAAVEHIDMSLHRRFLDERQILATLDHPNIAHILDGGATAAAIPYVVMEYVDGQPIHNWCRDQKLTEKQRIELFIEVVRAVDYAHRHLVVHRDLKPENIYVSREGAPKLLDFGIAKVLGPARAGMSSSVTVDASRMMTPDYASPEQVQGKPITTATDIYQLGSVLHFLLTGQTMFAAYKKTTGELERAICEVEVPRTQLNADLDLILRKSVEKDPLRRYMTAADLADDLQRYLNGEAILARPDSWLYRTQKFVRRNRVPTIAASLIALLVIVSAVVAGVLAKRYRQERNKFEAQRDIAEVRLRQSSLEADLLKKIFLAGDPVNTATKKMSEVELLDRDYENVEKLLQNDAEVRIDMLDALAKAYADIERPDREEVVLREDVALRSALDGAQSPSVRDCLIRLDTALSLEGKNEEATLLRHQIIDLAKNEQGINSGRSINLAHRLYVAETNNLPGREQRKEREQSVQLSLARDLADTDDPMTRYGHLLEDYGRLGEIYRTNGDLARAADEQRMVINTVDHGNPNKNSDFARAREYAADPILRLAQIDLEEGNYQQAERDGREVFGILQKVPSEGVYPDVTNVMGLILAMEGKYDEARAFFQLEEHVITTKYHNDRRLLFLHLVSEASMEEHAGNLPGAEKLLDESLQVVAPMHGRDTMLYVSGELQLIRVLIKEHKLKAADAAVAHSMSVLEPLHEPSPLMEGDLYADRAALAIVEQHWDAAEIDANYASNLFTKQIPLAKPRIANAMNLQAAVLEHKRQIPQVKALHAQAAKLGDSFISGTEWVY